MLSKPAGLKSAFLSLLFLIAFEAQAQKEASLWYFGGAVGIDFRSGTATAALDGKLTSNEGCASICDKDGKLLLYTNGEIVWNRKHEVISGAVMGNHSAAQGAMLIPLPGSDKRVLVFGVDGYTKGLSWSEIDLGLNDGEFSGTATNLTTNCLEAMGAVRHCNGRDAWVIVHEKNNRNFLAFLVTDKGVQPTPIVSSVGIEATGIFGYLKISPDGKLISMMQNNGARYGTFIFNFDNASGRVTGLKASVPDHPSYGQEFSASSRFLYLTGPGYNITQLDLTAGDSTAIVASRVLIPISISPFGAMQLGPDGKIYLSYVNEYVGAINFPEKKGPACQFDGKALYLGGNRSVFGLPSFLVNYFYPHAWHIYIKEKCPSLKVYFTSNAMSGVDSVNWDFGDTLSGKADHSSEAEPFHIFSAPGKYRVGLTVFSNCETARKDTLIEVQQGIQTNIFPDDTLLCPGATLLLDPEIQNATYFWSNGSTDPEISVNTEGEYWVEIITLCDTIRDTINVRILAPVKLLSKDTTICKAEEFELNAQHGTQWVWDNGATTRQIIVSRAGKYRLQALVNGCWLKDSITISEYPSIWVRLGQEYYICEEENELQLLDAGKGFKEYLWLPTGDTTQWIIVSKYGSYFVIVGDFRGCSASDSTLVKRRCPASLFFPNAFSPQGDVLNDVFRPVGNDVTSFQMVIYNRWGERLFETDEVNTGWDGTFKHLPAQEGLYIWMASWTGYDASGKLRNYYRNGQVHLLR